MPSAPPSPTIWFPISTPPWMFSCHCRKWALISIVRLVGLLLLFATALVALYDCGMTAEPGGAGGASEMRSIEETSNEPEPTLMGGGSKPPKQHALLRCTEGERGAWNVLLDKWMRG